MCQMRDEKRIETVLSAEPQKRARVGLILCARKRGCEATRAKLSLNCSPILKEEFSA